MWFYYSDRRHWFRPGPKPEDAGVQRIGIATLRIDGCASLNAGAESGTVVTRPLTFAGKSLFVNADVGRDGYVKVEVRSAQGDGVEGHAMAGCQRVTGNVFAGRIKWDGGDTIVRPPKTSWRLAFELKNAKLYSFWIE